jgi:hypothetical protein
VSSRCKSPAAAASNMEDGSFADKFAI